MMALNAQNEQPDLHSTFFSPQVDRWLIVEISQIYRNSINRPWVSKCQQRESNVTYVVKSNQRRWNNSVKVNIGFKRLLFVIFFSLVFHFAKFLEKFCDCWIKI